MAKKRTLMKKAQFLTALPASYLQFLKELKDKIRKAQIRANLSVNIELLKLYWEIGKAVVERQEHEKWGAKVIERLGDDLQKEFPGIEGFSKRNIFRMRKFYASYQIVPQAVALF